MIAISFRMLESVATCMNTIIATYLGRMMGAIAYCNFKSESCKCIVTVNHIILTTVQQVTINKPSLTAKLTLKSKIGVDLYSHSFNSPEWMALMIERVCFSLKREPTPYLHSMHNKLNSTQLCLSCSVPCIACNTRVDSMCSQTLDRLRTSASRCMK